MSSPVEKIKERLNIVDVVNSYIKLEKAGANYRACCPFHNEKTPSFFVSPSRQSFHCFGCDKGGDLISFVQEIENVDFKTALELLAERAGINLVYKNPQEASLNSRLTKIAEIAMKFYQKNLIENPQAVKYLKERGLDEKIINDYSLGYAPLEWRLLTSHLESANFSLVEAEQIGLVVKSNKNGRESFYDRFRGRIIFPLFNSTGKIAGFSSRIFDDEKNRTSEGKYVNSPQSPIFDKSKILYGYSTAKSFIRQKDYCLIVEGQIDLLLSHQAGYKNTVAVSGTSFSDYHLNLLGRLTEKLLIAFDSDLAGQNATSRVIDLALRKNFETLIVPLPTGQDPADVISSGLSNWEECLNKAEHVIDFYLRIIKKDYSQDRMRIKKIRQTVYPLITKLGFETDRAHFLRKIATLVNLPENSVFDEFNLQFRKQGAGLEKDKVGNKINSITRQEKVLQKIFGLYFLFSDNKDIENEKKWRTKIEDIVKPAKFLEYKDRFEEGKNSIIWEAEMLIKESSSEKVLDELMGELKLEILKKDLADTISILRQAEQDRDEVSVDKYLKRCQDISREINSLKL